MKRLLIRGILTLYLPFISLLGWGQSYQSMLDGFREWSLLSCNGPNCLIDYYWTGNDTFLLGKTYTILQGYHFDGTVLIREDTATRRVFLRAVGAGTLDPDNLTYDFSLQAGDSMRVSNTQAPIPENSGWFTVDSVRMIDYLGTIRKTLYLSGNDTTLRDLNRAIWVEGIGSLSIINTPGLYPNENNKGATNCAHVDGKLIFRLGTERPDSCTTRYTGPAYSIHEQPTKENFRMYPQPAQDWLRLDHLSGRTFDWILRDLHGKILMQGNQEVGQVSINVSLLPKGLYLMQVDDGLNHRVLKFSK